jgi:hypothetical protein
MIMDFVAGIAIDRKALIVALPESNGFAIISMQ